MAWLGKTECDMCHKNIKESQDEYFYDCKTIYNYWALLCQGCFNDIGKNIGQKYNVLNNEKICDLIRKP